jgi:2Fe-2S ferredoxin
MVQVTYITFDGKEQTVDVKPGYSLMEGAVFNDVVGIDADCGGNCYCGTCRGYIASDWRKKLRAPDEYERQLVEAVGDANPEVRLCCQIKVTEEMDGIVIRLPKSQQR